LTDLEVYLLGEGTQQRLDDKLGVSIYEVHLGSWRRKGNNEWLTYRDHVTGLFASRGLWLPEPQPCATANAIEADDRDQTVRPRTKAIRVSTSWRQDANTSSCALVARIMSGY
jgi:hypothetical protein